MRLAQHCRSDTCFTLVVAASSELIDDQAPWLYDLLRIVRKSCGYECVRFTQFYFLGDDPPVPLSLLAADTGSAILHSEGGVWLNGTEISGSTAVFPGDSVETKPGFVANLDAEGSSVLVQGESIVKFQGDSLTLEHVGASRWELLL